MKYFRYLVVAAMIFGTTLTSCKENDDNPREFNVSLLDSIFVSEHNPLSDNIHQIKHEYEYGCQNRITKRGTVRYGYSDYLLYYNANGDIIKYTSCYTASRCYRFTFAKNGNKVNILIKYHPSAYHFETVNGELELNSQELPTKLTYERVNEYDGSCGLSRRVSTYTTIAFTWQNGNLTKKECESKYETLNYSYSETDCESKGVTREESSITSTNTFTYDDKKTPFYYCNTPKWALLLLNYYEQDVNYGYNKNNRNTVTTEDGNSITYEYTYNDDELPVTRTWKEETITYTETYTYRAMGSASNDVCTLDCYW
jgi:hypothetical protein